MKESATIGTIRWDVCSECEHSDVDEGGCDLSLHALNNSLELSDYDCDTLVCSSFRPRDGGEDKA